ncbi:unnamed protein product [Ectocarpus sp. 8 AP-2014]
MDSRAAVTPSKTVTRVKSPPVTTMTTSRINSDRYAKKQTTATSSPFANFLSTDPTAKATAPTTPPATRLSITVRAPTTPITAAEASPAKRRTAPAGTCSRRPISQCTGSTKAANGASPAHHHIPTQIWAQISPQTAPAKNTWYTSNSQCTRNHIAAAVFTSPSNPVCSGLLTKRFGLVGILTRTAPALPG